MEYFAEYDFNGLGKIFYFVDGEKKYIKENFDYDKWERAKMSPDEEVQLSTQRCVKVERNSKNGYKEERGMRYTLQTYQTLIRDENGKEVGWIDHAENGRKWMHKNGTDKVIDVQAIYHDDKKLDEAFNAL